MIFLFFTYLLSPLFFCLLLIKRAKTDNILIIQTAKIGDFVSTTPLIQKVRSNFPKAKLTVLAHPNCEVIARTSKNIDNVLILPNRGYKGLKAKFWLWSRLLLNFDIVIICSPNITNILISFLALCPKRISAIFNECSKTLKYATFFLNYTERHYYGERYQSSLMKSLEFIGVPYNFNENLKNSFPFVEHNFYLLTKHKNKNLVGIGISASNKFKSLSFEQINKLIENLIKINDLVVVLVGTSADFPEAKKIYQRYPRGRIINSVGKIPLESLGSFMHNLQCYVGVDSGATYVADAVGIPVISIMGPASANDQKPLGLNSIIIESNEICSPCTFTYKTVNRCHLGTNDCIRKLDLYKIANLIQTILSSKKE